MKRQSKQRFLIEAKHFVLQFFFSVCKFPQSGYRAKGVKIAFRKLSGIAFANSHLKFAHIEGEICEKWVVFVAILLDHNSKRQGGGILMAPSESQILHGRHSLWMFFLHKAIERRLCLGPGLQWIGFTICVFI